MPSPEYVTKLLYLDPNYLIVDATIVALKQETTCTLSPCSDLTYLLNNKERTVNIEGSKYHEP